MGVHKKSSLPPNVAIRQVQPTYTCEYQRVIFQLAIHGLDGHLFLLKEERPTETGRCSRGAKQKMIYRVIQQLDLLLMSNTLRVLCGGHTMNGVERDSNGMEEASLLGDNKE